MAAFYFVEREREREREKHCTVPCWRDTKEPTRAGALGFHTTHETVLACGVDIVVVTAVGAVTRDERGKFSAV